MYKKCIYLSLSFLFYARQMQAAQEIQAPKKATTFVQDPRMAQNKDMSHYIASLKTKFPHATEAYLKNYINDVLKTKSNESTWLPWQKAPTMNPQDVTNYKPNLENLNDAGSISFIQLTKNNDLMGQASLQAVRNNSIALPNKSIPNDTHLTSSTQNLLRIKPAQKENIAPDNNLQMIVYDPAMNHQTHTSSNLPLIPYEGMAKAQQSEQAQPKIVETNRDTTQSTIQYDEQGNPTIINNTGIQQNLGFDLISKTYYVQKNNTREYLDPNTKLSADAHQKVVDRQNANIKALQDQIVHDQVAIAEQPPITKTIQQQLSSLWKNSKIPTTAEIKEAFNNMYKTLQDRFHITIIEPIKNSLFKQAEKILPDGKDPKKVASWSKSIQKTIYQWTLNFHTSLLSITSKEQLGLGLYENISDLQPETQTAYFTTKYISYLASLDMYKVIHPTTDAIANSLSNAIAKEIIGNQTIPQKEIDAIHKKFVEQFTQWMQDDALKLENAYKTLGLKPTADIAAVTKAYKKTSLKTHPDKKDGSHAKFQATREAYDTIIQNMETKSDKDPTKELIEKIQGFKTLIHELVQDINSVKNKAQQAQESLRSTARDNFDNTQINGTKSEHLPDEYSLKDSQTVYKSIVHKIIENGKTTMNENGTTTYTMIHPLTKESAFVIVDSQGNITSMNNINNLNAESWWSIFY